MAIQKVMGFPVGKRLSDWLYRLNTQKKEHPYRFLFGGLMMIGGIVYYDSKYTFGETVYSPVLSTDLVYKMKAETVEKPRAAALDHLVVQVRSDREQEELNNIKENAKNTFNDSTMVVTRGQVAVRKPHWNLRMNERNWSVLARDQQHQQDEYWYRAERSREDDFGRNTYGK